MAGLFWTATTGEITTGTSLKTCLQIIAATNVRIKVHEWSVSFKGTSNTDAPILAKLVRQTDAGTMSALTLRKVNESDGETLQSTAQHTATAEPTTTDLVDAQEIHPQMGDRWQAPFGREILVKGGNRLGLSVTAGASTSAVAHILGEE